MKKDVILFGVLFLVLTIGLNGAFAEEINENDQVVLAYNCLKDIVENRTCDSLPIGDQIFALLSIGECESELLSQAKKNINNESECWPKNRCDVKTTAQAILALHESGTNAAVAEEWLLNQRMVPDELVWYLEIDTNVESACNITYGTDTDEIIIGEDKIITPIGSLGECLSFNSDFGNYWLEIESGNCLEKEFKITCDERFLTTLLFREEGENTIHVLDRIQTGTETGTTKEKIESYCFKNSQGCDYEGSLWATVILDYLGEDISEFIPYLITTYKEHRNDFPEPFLYILTDELQYKTELMDFQIGNEQWDRNTGYGKYYDTALALLPFSGSIYRDEIPYEKENTINWLLDLQPDSGCWDGENIVSTGFILYSIWPHLGPGEVGVTVDDDEDNDTSYDNDCELSGYFCMSSRNCGGDILSEYSCEGFPNVCCSQENIQPTCSDLEGEVCASNEYCLGGNTQSVVGLGSGESCCVGGSCEVQVVDEENECVLAGGICESISCASGYKESQIDTCDFDDVCCVPDNKTGGNYLWIWILFILVILVVVAIIYREKLKGIYYKMKSKGGKSSGTTQQPRRPGYPPTPGYNRRPSRPPMQRKIMPPQQQPRRPIQKPARNPRELDDVLKKLKQMGK